MTRFTHAGAEYRITFDHQAKGTGAGTICSVEMGTVGTADHPNILTWEAHYVGEAKLRCEPEKQDPLHRPLGRELSLTRAVQLMPRSLRGATLAAYYRAHNRATVPDWAKRLLQEERRRWSNVPPTAAFPTEEQTR